MSNDVFSSAKRRDGENWIKAFNDLHADPLGDLDGFREFPFRPDCWLDPQRGIAQTASERATTAGRFADLITLSPRR